MALSWQERASRVRQGESALASEPIDIDGSLYKAMFEAIFRHTADSVVLCHSVTGEYFEVSDMFCELTGYSREELLGRSSATLGLVAPDGVRRRIEQEGSARQRGLYENQLFCQDGSRRWVEFSHQEIGEDLTMVLIRDITAVKETEESLRVLASTDALTHVLNRGAFQARATETLARWPEALLVVADVDGLKAINDTWGHAVGDEAIVAIATALVSAAGRDGFVGRLGGDEFAALLTGATEDRASAVHRVRAAMVDIRLASAEVTVSATVGVASGRLAYAALEQAADTAMYQGKHAFARPASNHPETSPHRRGTIVRMARGWARRAQSGLLHG